MALARDTGTCSFVLEEAGDDGDCVQAMRFCDEPLAGVGEATARENLVT